MRRIGRAGAALVAAALALGGCGRGDAPRTSGAAGDAGGSTSPAAVDETLAADAEPFARALFDAIARNDLPAYAALHMRAGDAVPDGSAIFVPVGRSNDPADWVFWTGEVRDDFAAARAWFDSAAARGAPPAFGGLLRTVVLYDDTSVTEETRDHERRCDGISAIVAEVRLGNERIAMVVPPTARTPRGRVVRFKGLRFLDWPAYLHDYAFEEGGRDEDGAVFFTDDGLAARLDGRRRDEVCALLGDPSETTPADPWRHAPEVWTWRRDRLRVVDEEGRTAETVHVHFDPEGKAGRISMIDFR